MKNRHFLEIPAWSTTDVAVPMFQIGLSALFFGIPSVALAQGGYSRWALFFALVCALLIALALYSVRMRATEVIIAYHWREEAEPVIQHATLTPAVVTALVDEEDRRGHRRVDFTSRVAIEKWKVLDQYLNTHGVANVSRASLQNMARHISAELRINPDDYTNMHRELETLRVLRVGQYIKDVVDEEQEEKLRNTVEKIIAGDIILPRLTPSAENHPDSPETTTTTDDDRSSTSGKGGNSPTFPNLRSVVGGVSARFHFFPKWAQWLIRAMGIFTLGYAIYAFMPVQWYAGESADFPATIDTQPIFDEPQITSLDSDTNAVSFVANRPLIAHQPGTGASDECIVTERLYFATTDTLFNFDSGSLTCVLAGGNYDAMCYAERDTDLYSVTLFVTGDAPIEVTHVRRHNTACGIAQPLEAIYQYEVTK